MAEFTEQQVYEALGLGEQAQEPAEPVTAQTSEPEGEQVQEPAEPAEDAKQPAEGTRTEPTAAADAPDDPEDDAAAGTQEGKQPLTPEQRRENAAKRRQQELPRQQEAINQAVQAAVRQEQDKHAGILQPNPQERALLEAYVAAHLHQGDDGLWRFDHKRAVSWAFISWNR